MSVNSKRYFVQSGEGMISRIIVLSLMVLLLPVISCGVALGGKAGKLRVPVSATNTATGIPLIIKETAGTGAERYPVDVVVPFAKGEYQKIEKFRVVNNSGKTVPAQFNILNRWWADDESIRHLKVHFQPQVGAYAGTPKSGISAYYLKNDGSGNDINTNLRISDEADVITVVTGKIKFTINKRHFTIIDELWLDSNRDGNYEDNEKIICSSIQNGGRLTEYIGRAVQFDSTRTDVRYTVEENGPMEVIIKAEALTKYFSFDNHQHGFAVRIFAYADAPYIKIDYQLQNSAKNVADAGPLYFDEMKIDFKLNLSNPVATIDPGNGKLYRRVVHPSGLGLRQEHHGQADIHLASDNSVVDANFFSDKWLAHARSSAFLDVSDKDYGVMATVRNFWQMFPNGLKIEDNVLSIELWPLGLCHWEDEDGSYLARGTCGNDVKYWLEDMQQTYKEIMLYFHPAGLSDDQLKDLSQTFQYHPVGIVPVAQYERARATLDMGGFMPTDSVISSKDSRILNYTNSRDFSLKWNDYKFGWDNYYMIEKGRKYAPAMAGGGPKTSTKFILSQNPSDYYLADDIAMAEINIRNQSMAGYNYEAGYPAIKFIAKAFQPPTWRSLAKPYNGSAYRPHSWNMRKPRDNGHGWFYHVEEAYYITGNPWIKDWYQFMGGVRKQMFDHPETADTRTSRALGHSIASAIQAYRITGDTRILEKTHKYINETIRPQMDPIYGFKESLIDGGGEAAFQVGFLTRAIITYMEEIKQSDPQAWASAFQLVSACMEWNINFSNFSYYLRADKGEMGVSNSTSWTMVDPQAWYYLNTGKRKYLEQLNQYIDHGIGEGGRTPSMNVRHWKGQFEGRYAQFVRENTKPDTSPPAAIINLTVEKPDDTHIRLTWANPMEASRYHIVYSNKPISPETTTDINFTNWWAADVIGSKAQGTFNVKEISSPFYVAVFSFDANGNMSAMSNLAKLDS